MTTSTLLPGARLETSLGTSLGRSESLPAVVGNTSVPTLWLVLGLTVGLMVGLAIVSSPASAAPPSVAGQTYDACGPWKNRLRNYRKYEVDNYNKWVPSNFAVPSYAEVPRSVWSFFDDGLPVGLPEGNAFIGVLDIIDETGTSMPQVVSGSYQQKKAKITMTLDPGPTQDVFVPASDTLGCTGLGCFPPGFPPVFDLNLFVTDQPHGLYNGQGPFRFVEGTIPDGDRSPLPGGIDETTDYYVLYVNDTLFGVTLTPGGPVVDLTSQGGVFVCFDAFGNEANCPSVTNEHFGVHRMTPAGQPLENSFSDLSELFLFGDRQLVGVVDFVSLSRLKLKAKINKDGSELKIKFSGRTNYDIDTEDVEGIDFNGRTKYTARTRDCAPIPSED